MSVLEEIVAERKRQDEQWGGPEFDDGHDLGTWLWILEKHFRRMREALITLGDSDSGDDGPTDPEAIEDVRRRLVVLAALAVALAESNDRVYAVPH